MKKQLTNEEWKLFSLCISHLMQWVSLNESGRNWIKNSTLAATRGELTVRQNPIEILYPDCDYIVQSWGKSDKYGHRWVWYEKEEYYGKSTNR